LDVDLLGDAAGRTRQTVSEQVEESEPFFNF